MLKPSALEVGVGGTKGYARLGLDASYAVAEAFGHEDGAIDPHHYPGRAVEQGLAAVTVSVTLAAWVAISIYGPRIGVLTLRRATTGVQS